MEPLHYRLGHHAMVDDLADLGVADMLQYDPHEDKSQNVETFPVLDEEQKVGSQYLNAEIPLPRRDKIDGGQVVHLKHDADGNTLGRSNQNLILDTHLYEVEFPGGEIE